MAGLINLKLLPDFFNEIGHQRRFKRKPRTSAFSPDSGHIAASHRSATKSADARRGAADGVELRQAAGAADAR